MRPMRRARQALEREDCLRILQAASSGVLAVQGEEGYPYAVPLSFVLHQGKIYFHCAPEGHKIDAIARESRVSFCVISRDDVLPEKFTTLFESVIVFGRARVIREEAAMRPLLAALAEKYSPGVPGLEEEIASSIHRMAMIELTPERITGKECIESVRARRTDPPASSGA